MGPCTLGVGLVGTTLGLECDTTPARPRRTRDLGWEENEVFRGFGFFFFVSFLFLLAWFPFFFRFFVGGPSLLRRPLGHVLPRGLLLVEGHSP